MDVAQRNAEGLACTQAGSLEAVEVADRVDGQVVTLGDA